MASVVLLALVLAVSSRPLQAVFQVETSVNQDSNDVGRPARAARPAALVACLAAFSVLACAALMFYVVKSLCSRVLADNTAWRLVPHFWHRTSTETGARVRKQLQGVEEGARETDQDEKHQDATSLDLPVSPAGPLVDTSPGPVPVPASAWSARAIDGLVPTPSDPHPHPHASRRAYRSAVPELDMALAMQLRPGGADAAWMVRFLMTVFGWLAVATHARTYASVPRDMFM